VALEAGCAHRPLGNRERSDETSTTAGLRGGGEKERDACWRCSLNGECKPQTTKDCAREQPKDAGAITWVQESGRGKWKCDAAASGWWRLPSSVHADAIETLRRGEREEPPKSRSQDDDDEPGDCAAAAGEQHHKLQEGRHISHIHAPHARGGRPGGASCRGRHRRRRGVPARGGAWRSRWRACLFCWLCRGRRAPRRRARRRRRGPRARAPP